MNPVIIHFSKLPVPVTEVVKTPTTVCCIVKTLVELLCVKVNAPEPCPFDDFIACSGAQGAKAKGLCRVEGKQYTMQDGDVVYFRTGQ